MSQNAPLIPYKSQNAPAWEGNQGVVDPHWLSPMITAYLKNILNDWTRGHMTYRDIRIHYSFNFSNESDYNTYKKNKNKINTCFRKVIAYYSCWNKIRYKTRVQKFSITTILTINMAMFILMKNNLSGYIMPFICKFTSTTYINLKHHFQWN